MTVGAFPRAALAAAITTLSALSAGADFNDNKPISYTVDGATATGYFKVVAEAVNGIVREHYPGTAATYKPGSPAGGILNISKGQSDLTFTAGAPEIAFALDGKAPFTESLRGKFSFVMLIYNSLVVHSLMTKDWAERNGIKSFSDIAAKKPQMRLHVNQIANLQSTLGMYVTIFDAYGIKEEEVTKGGSIFRSNAAGGFDALRDGKIDVYINGGFLPTAEVATCARTRADVGLGRSGQDHGSRRTLGLHYDHGAEGRLSVRQPGRVHDHSMECDRRRRACLGGDSLQVHQGDGRQCEPRAFDLSRRCGSLQPTRSSATRPSFLIIRAPPAIIARRGC